MGDDQVIELLFGASSNTFFASVNLPKSAYPETIVFQVNPSLWGIFSNSFRASSIRPDPTSSFKDLLMPSNEDLVLAKLAMLQALRLKSKHQSG